MSFWIELREGVTWKPPAVNCNPERPPLPFCFPAVSQQPVSQVLLYVLLSCQSLISRVAPQFQVDPAYTGRVGASEAALFLKKSGLSDIILGKVCDERQRFLFCRHPQGSPGRWRPACAEPSSWGLYSSWEAGWPLRTSRGYNWWMQML